MLWLAVVIGRAWYFMLEVTKMECIHCKILNRYYTDRLSFAPKLDFEHEAMQQGGTSQQASESTALLSVDAKAELDVMGGKREVLMNAKGGNSFQTIKHATAAKVRPF
jgi:hypothetical protein